MKKIIFLVVFLASTAIYAQEKSILTPLDVAKLQSIAGSEVSPDGKKIAYYLVVPANPLKKNEPARLHLYLYDVATKQTSPFITSYSVGNIAFRPNYNTLTFTAKREGDNTTSIYEISLNGGEAQKLYSFENSISGYDWHPNGQKLVFIASNAATQAGSSLPYEPEVYEESLRTSAAYVVNINDGKENEINLEGHVTAAKWSPNGNRIALSAAPTSLVDDFYTSQKIYVINPETLEASANIDHKAKLGDFQWSPDGNQIAFIGGEDQHDPIEGRLLIADVKGGQPTNLVPNFKGAFETIEWKDKSTIYFLASEGVATSFGTITTAGKMRKILDNKATAYISFSAASNTISLVGSTAMHPNELYTMSPEDKTPERITNTNPWLQNELLGKQEVITYKSTDGLTIEGILIHPVKPEEGKNPLITVVHGGPEAHYDNGRLTGYSSPGQMAAGMGYAVFYPNYRGSTGRGVEFAKLSQADPGGKEFDDIIDGIDYLIENKNIDKSRVGVTGGSYGGYATGWMSTRHTDRFAAGVMFVGISNNLSKWGTSDIPEEMFLVHSRKRIWDDYQFFLERSPIYYAGQANTPLLILAGKEDTRVDPGQSYELYRHIKTRTDTPVRLVLYPGEGHGNRRSASRYDYSIRMMRWFNTFLKDNNDKMPEADISVEVGK